jgi:hypothetical protein
LEYKDDPIVIRLLINGGNSLTFSQLYNLLCEYEKILDITDPYDRILIPRVKNSNKTIPIVKSLENEI